MAGRGRATISRGAAANRRMVGTSVPETVIDRLNNAPAWAWLVGAVVVLALCLAVPVLRVLAPIAAMAIGAGVDDMTR